MTAELTPPAQAPVPTPGGPRPAGDGPSPLSFFLTLPGALLAFVAVTLAVYSPVLGGEFLWDDSFLVRGNALIRSPLFCLEVFRHTLFTDNSNFYRPAQSLTYIADYWFWGSEPFGYHLTNALVQAVNGFLLFTLGRRVLPVLLPPVGADALPPVRRAETDRLAFALALAWVLHPVHSAAVAYISGRADSLAMLFCLTAWLGCERALALTGAAPRWGWGLGAFGCLVLGLCSKEIAFVWLVLFAGWLLVLRPVGQAERRGHYAILAGAVLALGLYLCLRHLPPPPPPAPSAPSAAMPAKGVLMLRALGDYARLMLFPHRLFMERQVFAAPGLTNPSTALFYNALAAGGALVLMAFAFGAWLPGRGRLLRRCGAVWFLVGFLPVSNLFSLNASVAEHWLYLPSIGFLLFLAGAALDIPWRRLPAGVRTPGFAVAALLLVIGALGARTWLRAHDWADKLTFYRQTIRDGGDVPRAREGLSLALLDAGGKATAQAATAADPAERETLAVAAKDQFTAAVALLERITAAYPHAYSARVNLATALLRLGHADEAHAGLQRLADELLATDDRRAGPRECAVTIQALDRLETPGDPSWRERRHALLDKAAGRYPESWELLQIRLADAENAGDPATALALARSYAVPRWWHVASWIAVGRLLAATGRADEAIDTWSRVAGLDVHGAEAPACAAALCLATGRPEEALAWQRNAVRRQPDSPRQHLLLARMLERSGRNDEAARERDLAAHLTEPDRG